MRKLKQLVCDHDFEPQAVHADSGELFRKCRHCGKRVAESGSVS